MISVYMFDGMRKRRVFVLIVAAVSLFVIICAGAGIVAAATHNLGNDKSTGKSSDVTEETFYSGDYSGVSHSAQDANAPYYFLGGEHEAYYINGGESDPYYRSGGEAEGYYEDAEITYYYYYWFWYWVWMLEHPDNWWDDDYSDDDYYYDDDVAY
jgi:hypothetical protein